MRITRFIAAVCALIASCCAFAQNGVALGVEVGVFIPQDREMREIFGDTLLKFGIGPVGTGRPTAGKLRPEISVIAASDSGNRFLLIPVTLGYEHHFNTDNENSIPYVRVSAGLAYLDYDIEHINGPRFSDRTFTGTGAIEAGIVLNQRLRLAAKYSIFGEKDGFNFNGFQLSATFAVVRF